MKRVILIVAVLMIQSVKIGSSMALPFKKHSVEVKIETDQEFTLDVLTVYNPVESQTDDTPLVTASMKKINKQKLLKGQLRWMALSRDMLTRWGGQIKYGDTITIHSQDITIKGKWVVQDTMNKKYRNRGDVMFHENVRKLGLWKNICFTKSKHNDKV